MKTKLSIIIQSHLNDARIEAGSMNTEMARRSIMRMAFVQWLLFKFKNTSIEIDPDEEFDLFHTSYKVQTYR